MALPTSLSTQLAGNPRTWLVTGAAGFIGSNIVEALLGSGQTVVGLDNFETGKQANLQAVKAADPDAYDSHFKMIEGDILDLETCRDAAAGCDIILHQAALGSVPQSIEFPARYHAVNVTGFVNMLEAARTHDIRRIVYASSSAVYGDDPAPEKLEEQIGRALSPYAVTKRTDELYAIAYADNYALEAVGLRYFNIFGKRQDPNGSYAAVIPKWIDAMKQGDEVRINGDGETTRDFCHVDNVVQANVLAATRSDIDPGAVFNVGAGKRTSLNELFETIRDALAATGHSYDREPVHGEFRAGDIRHSLADIGRARSALGFSPDVDLATGLADSIPYYG